MLRSKFVVRSVQRAFDIFDGGRVGAISRIEMDVRANLCERPHVRMHFSMVLMRRGIYLREIPFMRRTCARRGRAGTRARG